MATDRQTAAVSRGEMARALKALAGGRRRMVVAGGSHVELSDEAGGSVRLRSAVLVALARRGLVARSGNMLAPTADGAAWLRREVATGEPFQDQHRDMETIEVALPAGRALAGVNLAESPLGQLARRKDRGGRAFLTEAEVRAGEKLRADYTRGQIMPRVSANWDAAVVTGRRGAPAAEITDGALAARTRVERAIDAVGPELAGVVVDVCCFLKGLETVEAERGWPVRSAKVVLKAALAALSRHYEPPADAKRGRRRIVNWGASDYRPTIR